jgi:hypothetical protein
MPSNFLRMYLAVSLKRSKRRTGGTAGRNPHGRTTPHSREGRNLIAEYGSWQQPPPIRDPLTQHVEHIATQTEIIRMRTRPLKTGHQPSPIRRNVRQPIIRPKLQQLERRLVRWRTTMARHFSRPPTENADAAHGYAVSPATHPTQTPTPNPDAASQTPCEHRPTTRTTATMPQPASHQDRRSQAPAAAQQSTAAYDAAPLSSPLANALSSASLLSVDTRLASFQRARIALWPCFCPGRNPTS